MSLIFAKRFRFPRQDRLVIDRSIPLSELPSGQSACVARISGRADHVHRLEEFGLRGGVRIQMFMPGNPCIIRKAGKQFAGGAV